MIYYLYKLTNSIKFDKCGATVEWDQRCRDNRATHGDQCEINVLETMEGPNTPEFWQVVGDREWELADLYGYPRGEHYRTAREKRQPTKEQLAKGGRIGGAKAGPLTLEKGLGLFGMTKDQKKAACSKGGKRSIANMRSYLTKEILSKGGKAGKGTPKAKSECPHCNRMIANNLIDRWHNDNCKHKKTLVN